MVLGSESLLRLQSRSWPGLWPSRGFDSKMVRSHSLAGLSSCWPLVRNLSSSPHSPLCRAVCFLPTRQLPISGESDPRDTPRQKLQCLLWPSLSSHIPSLLPCSIGWHRPILTECGRSLHNNVDITQQGWLEAILEIGFHTVTLVGFKTLSQQRKVTWSF